MAWQYFLVAQATFLVWVTGCSSKSTATPKETEVGDAGLTCPSGLTYRKAAKPFFDDYCRSCHGSSDEATQDPMVPHAFETEDDVMAVGAHVHEAIEGEKMPPRDSELPMPTYRERKAVLDWLECSGALENEPDEDHVHEE